MKGADVNLVCEGVEWNCLQIHVPCLYPEPNRGTHTFENSFETDRNTDTACRSVMCLAMMLFTVYLFMIDKDRPVSHGLNTVYDMH